MVKYYCFVILIIFLKYGIYITFMLNVLEKLRFIFILLININCNLI